MPFVRIFVSADFAQAQVSALSDGVHQAMIDTIDVPPDDRFQVVTRLERGMMIWDPGYLGVERSDRAVFVHITLRAGRDVSKKRALYRAIVERLSAGAGVRPADVLIVLAENSGENWSFGNGEAHYAPIAAPA